MSGEADLHPAYFATRFRVSAPVPVWPARFVIVTAYATTGEQWTAERNAEANASLAERIGELGVWSCPITGYDPATGHAEPGWAIAGPPSLGVQLGRAFQQNAIFAVEAGWLSVHACANAAHADVGPFLERVDVG